jgi:hypothetical protein
MDLENPTVVPAQTGTLLGDLFPPTMEIFRGDTPQAPVPAPEPAPLPAAEKIVLGNKIFNTMEEALAYANGVAESQARTSASLAPRETVQAPVPGKRLGQLVFEDPDQAFAQAKQEVLKEFREEQRKVDENAKFWQDFYLKHSDLRGSELLVDAVLGREHAAGRSQVLTVEQLGPILAAQSRQEISKIRNAPSGGQPLPSAPAVVAGASGASTQRTPVQPAPVSTSFIQELRGARKKG